LCRKHFCQFIRSFIISETLDSSFLEFRSPDRRDASKIWELVNQSGVLDLNSPYAYLLLCSDFQDTCLVVSINNSIVGFVTGYRLPRDPNTLFIWQIGVSPEVKRQGVGKKLLCELVRRCGSNKITAVEATIAPSNVVSRSLFKSVANSLKAPLKEIPEGSFGVSDFPTEGHEEEPRIRIGPIPN
jgi:L-2,4-diaminobutyric acid acetyltransferase